MTLLVAADFDAADWARWWPALQSAFGSERLVRSDRAVGDDAIDVALVANPAPGSLGGLPRLGLIQSLWAGVDRLIDDASVPSHVPLARMVDPAMNEAMAQTAHWAVLGLQRDFLDYATAQRAQRWAPQPLRRADDVQVTVLGMGQMGCAVSQRLLAHGYRVGGWRRSERPAGDLPAPSGAQALRGLLSQSDVVINLLPLTPQTRGMFDADLFDCFRQGASFVNLARGAHVVEADLLAALDTGRIRRAVLDVFATEPLPPGHPFWTHPSISVLPHVAAPTDPRSAAQIAARNVAAWRAGQAVSHLVNRARGY